MKMRKIPQSLINQVLDVRESLGQTGMLVTTNKKTDKLIKFRPIYSWERMLNNE